MIDSVAFPYQKSSLFAFNSHYVTRIDTSRFNSGILIVRSDAYRVAWNPLLMSSG